MKTVAELIAEARTWIGVPFLHQGRNRRGVDCAGLIEALAHWTGGLPRDYDAPQNYPRTPNGALEVVLARYCKPTKTPPERVPGCVVLIQWHNSARPSHVALCTGATLIHAYMRGRKVTEQGYRGRWVRDTHSAFLLPGVRYE